MATIPLPSDFSSFLRLLNEHDVQYLLIGGYAVGYYGYVRATADLDVWIPRDHDNSVRLVDALHAFGFDVPDLRPELFLEEKRIVRMGIPPIRIELMTSVSGVDFEACYAERVSIDWTGVDIDVISLGSLKKNKRASGRPKDLTDLDYLG